MLYYMPKLYHAITVSLASLFFLLIAMKAKGNIYVLCLLAALMFAIITIVVLILLLLQVA